MKRIISLFLVCVLMFCSVNVINASGDNASVIKSLKVESDVIAYAEDMLPKHVGVLDMYGRGDRYDLGDGFTLLNVEENTFSTCFAVLLGEDMVAILEIGRDGEKFYSSLSESFAKELQELLERKNNASFVLLTDGVHLQAYDGKEVYVLFELYDDGTEFVDLSKKIKLNFSQLMDVNPKNKLIIGSDLNVGRAVDGPRSYRTLLVKGVSQSGSTCWAATCAAIINYYKGTVLDDVTVAKYIYGNNWNQGGTWTEIKKAYNHWGLSPSQTGVISFDNVISNINQGKPMHLGLNGHSVGLIGYEDWRNVAGSGNEKILILLEPNGGVRKSVTMNSTGNFNYSLGGGNNAWIYTRKF